MMANFENCKWAKQCGHDLCLPEICTEFKEKRMTNSDRLRAMSDRELASFLAQRYANESVMRLRDSGHEPTATQIKALTEGLYMVWMRWLRQYVEVE
jgi:hypothetical protein